VQHSEAVPVAATGNIDAAMNAAKHTASASDLEAGSTEILQSWAVQRGHHKRAFGQYHFLPSNAAHSWLLPNLPRAPYKSMLHTRH
jgi:hypothetical protein